MGSGVQVPLSLPKLNDPCGRFILVMIDLLEDPTRGFFLQKIGGRSTPVGKAEFSKAGEAKRSRIPSLATKIKRPLWRVFI